jgi:hypothetical protein
MNSYPSNPLPGPAPPANIAIPPGGHPQIQIDDPPAQVSDDELEPTPIISDEFADGVLSTMFNVRASFPIGLGTPHPILSLGQRGVTLYTTMTRDKWNTNRLVFNSPPGAELRELMHSIYRSVTHHQQQLLMNPGSCVYALPRAKKFWVQVIPVLLAPFHVQFYIESNRLSSASIWGDFSDSSRPHPGEEDFYVELALNTAL